MRPNDLYLIRRVSPVILAALVATACKNDGTDDDTDTDDVDGTPTDIHLPLVQTVELTEGSEQCPGGGVLIQSGVDDGSGDDGVADDGVLQPGEVLSETVVCNGAPGADSNQYLPVEAPEGDVGTYTLDLSGGNGQAQSGGEGGVAAFEMSYGSRWGHTRLQDRGDVTATITPPANITSLGSEPLVISSNTTVPINDVPSSLPAGSAFQYSNNDNLYVWDGSTAERVTGVRVQSGATLTFSPTFGSYAEVQLEDGFLLEGTLTTTRSEAGGHYDLTIESASFQSASGSLVDLAGDDQPGGTGQAGGDFELDIEEGYAAGFTYGAILLEGNVDTSGGNGASGGDGGDVDFWATNSAWLLGSVNTSGGSASDGFAGGAGDIDAGSEGPVHLSGTWNLRGGDTTSANAGNGGDVDIESGPIVSELVLHTDGGTGNSSCTVCDGGNGGDVYAYAYGGDIVWTGETTTTGGNGFGTALAGITNAWGDGGQGGEFGLYTSYGGAGIGKGGPGRPAGSIDLAADLDLSGGNGRGFGGQGGGMYMYIDAYGNEQAEIRLWGYADADLSGGNSVDSTAGGGGYVYAYTAASYAFGDDYQPSGGFYSWIPFDLTGGDSTNASGGFGGNYDVWAYEGEGSDVSGQKAVNHADVDMSGGDGSNSGGPSGGMFLLGLGGAENHGALTSVGGDASGTGSYGGHAAEHSWNSGGLAIFSSRGEAINTGDVVLAGGSGTAFGGEGGDVQIAGGLATNSGACDLRGMDGAEGGGDGGELYLSSLDGSSTQSATDVKISGGSGVDYTGEDGKVIVDGADLSDQFLP